MKSLWLRKFALRRLVLGQSSYLVSQKGQKARKKQKERIVNLFSHSLIRHKITIRDSKSTEGVKVFYGPQQRCKGNLGIKKSSS